MWGVLIRSLSKDDTLYELNPQKLLMPASNMKIVTLAAAAERLGWSFTYETTLFAAGHIDGGTLHGDLVVVGSGDPSLGFRDGSADRVFDEWTERLKALDIRRIAGRIVGDDDAFEDQELGFGWSWDDLPDDYAAGVSALQFNENAVRITISPGPAQGADAAVVVDPAGSDLTIDASVATTPTGTSTSIVVRRLPGSRRLTIHGTIAAGGSPARRVVSVDNPTLFFVQTLRRALIDRGIDVAGDAVDIDDLRDRPKVNSTPIVVHRSPPLSTLAIRLMKDSQNQYAETLLKTLSAAPGAVASAAAGRAVAQQIFATWDIGPDGLIQRDGSGLSRYDYVSAATIVKILSHVYRDEKLRGPFEAALPVAGRDGTLASRMKGTPAEGNVRAKTGSMSNVRAVAGYLTTADREPLAFAVIANNFETTADVINKAADEIMLRLVTFSR